MTIDELLKWHVDRYLAEIFPTYHRELPQSFITDVIEDVKVSSAYPEDFL